MAEPANGVVEKKSECCAECWCTNKPLSRSVLIRGHFSIGLWNALFSGIRGCRTLGSNFTRKTEGGPEIAFLLFVVFLLSSGKILMQQNMIHTISKDFWQWKCQNIRQKLMALDTSAGSRYGYYRVTKRGLNKVPAEGPRTFWTSLDFPSKESTPEKVPAWGKLLQLGAAKSYVTNKPF